MSAPRKPGRAITTGRVVVGILLFGVISPAIVDELSKPLHRRGLSPDVARVGRHDYDRDTDDYYYSQNDRADRGGALELIGVLALACLTALGVRSRLKRPDRPYPPKQDDRQDDRGLLEVHGEALADRRLKAALALGIVGTGLLLLHFTFLPGVLLCLLAVLCAIDRELIRHRILSQAYGDNPLELVEFADSLNSGRHPPGGGKRLYSKKVDQAPVASDAMERLRA